jgi:hypothetical protein
MTANSNTPRVAKTVDGEAVSADLRPLLFGVFESLGSNPTDLRAVVSSLDDLLVFLSTVEGRTRSSCWATKSFFYREGWGDVSWDGLPDDVAVILCDIASQLHYTVEDPTTAELNRTTPELLLQRLRDVQLSNGAV